MGVMSKSKYKYIMACSILQGHTATLCLWVPRHRDCRGYCHCQHPALKEDEMGQYVGAGGLLVKFSRVHLIVF